MENFSGKSEKENIHSQTIVGKEDGIKNQVKRNKKRRWKGITYVSNISVMHM